MNPAAAALRAHAPPGAGYAGPWWLPSGHAQTILPALLGAAPSIRYTRERWDSLGADGLPDGDFVDIDWLADDRGGPRWIEGAPLVVMFHGLEGSSRSHYARALMHAVRARGWNGCVPHFRGCSGEINRLPRAYHSGDSAEVAWILGRIAATRKPRALYAAGISLGGNALMKWAGEQGAAAAGIARAIAAISSPLDLAAAGGALGRGFNLVYTRMFLETLKKKSLVKLRRFPGIFDHGQMHRSRNLYEFDNVVTAPLHGFRDTDDYWSRASAKPWMKQVAIPALALNAKNDPFMPAAALPAARDVSAAVLLEQPDQGGHVGFAGDGAPLIAIDWLPQRLLHFFESHP